MAEPLPPGRAGRLWLRSRLATAQRSIELLDRKAQLLKRELAGLSGPRDTARRRWADTSRQAQRWGLRASALGGSADIASASTVGRARVEIAWRNTMGVTHPGDPHWSAPTLAPIEAAAGGAAIGPAATAYRQALEAAVVYAAGERSYRQLEAELRVTEQRRRAIEQRRLPALRDALRRLEQRLDELEREERVVARWAGQRRGGDLSN